MGRTPRIPRTRTNDFRNLRLAPSRAKSQSESPAFSNVSRLLSHSQTETPFPIRPPSSHSRPVQPPTSNTQPPKCAHFAIPRLCETRLPQFSASALPASRTGLRDVPNGSTGHVLCVPAESAEHAFCVPGGVAGRLRSAPFASRLQCREFPLPVRLTSDLEPPTSNLDL